MKCLSHLKRDSIPSGHFDTDWFCDTSKYMEMIRFILPLLLLALVPTNDAVRYEPNWDSIDSRPIPEWYDEAKIGIFLHWGVFSVPSLYSEWFWPLWENHAMKEAVEYMKNNYKPNFVYADFAASFTGELFDPNQWASLFNASGAKYVLS